MLKRQAMTINEDFFRKLADISRKMAETRVLDPLLQYAMQMALELLNGERGYLVLVDADGALDFRVRVDRNGVIHTEEISMTILEHVFASREAMVIYDAITDPTLAKASSVQALGLRSVLCAPLISRGVLLGAIYLENRSAAAVFHQTELEPLTFFANQAAVSIENALMNDSLAERVRTRTKDLEYAVKQLERGWLEAVEANRIRTTILANVAHDIRSPIGLAISAIQTIREGSFGGLTAKQTEWMDRVLDSLNYAVTLTSDIFDLSKAELEALRITPEPVNLKAFMQHLHQLGEGIEWDEGVEFTVELPRDLPTIQCDPVRIQQVIFNLLSNAQKFTTQGSVRLYARVLADAVEIGVYDTGTGIPAEQRDKIFERFHQVKQDSDLRVRGTGLGLAISRELVELHGGTIRVQSEEGVYSDFSFTLPLN